MRWIRVYAEQDLSPGSEVEIHGQAARHLTQVLRLRVGDRFSVFNGDGYDYPATITLTSKQRTTAQLAAEREARPRPKRPFILGQALIKGERMDWAIQKSVELGVGAIVPLISERTEVRLKAERLEKRLRHWQGVANSACEQCGRADVPTVEAPRPWHEWMQQVQAAHRLVLVPGAEQALANYPLDEQSIAIAVGPEGGWSEQEAHAWQAGGFTAVRLDELILRAETASLAAAALIQYRS
jgi:16S rRNA (uracil1498-N3)-methyltransferase